MPPRKSFKSRFRPPPDQSTQWPSHRPASSVRRRVAEGWQAAEKLQARALAAGGLGVWAWDLDTDRVTCSPDLEALCGLAPGTSGGTSEAIVRRVHPEDRDSFGEAARQTLETGQDHYALHRIVRPDGIVRWIEARGQAVRDETGRVCGMTGVSMDVTARVEAEAEARAREGRLQALADNVPVLIARVDTARRYVFANRAYEDMLGIPAALVIGKTMAEVLGAAAYETIRLYVDRALAGEAVEYDAILPYRTIGARFIHAAYAPEHGADGAVTGFLLSVIDITARWEVEEATRRAEEATRRLALIVENSRDAILSMDLDCTVLSWNRGAERLYGWTAAEVVGKSLAFTFPPEQAMDDMVPLLDALERAGGALEYEAVRIRKDGARREVAVTFSPIHDVQGRRTGRAFIVRDITAQKEAERERARLQVRTAELLAQTEVLLTEATDRADRDPLTGLLNHRAFQNKLEEETDRAGRGGTFLAVAMLDLDHFKFFNDAYGHPVGDDALRQVADALRRTCRPYDTPARYGGDEFAVLMPGVGRSETAAIADRLARSLEGITIRPPGGTVDVPLHLSIGLAVFPDEGRSRAEAIALADKRLYLAKSSEGQSGTERAGDAEQLRGQMRAAVEGFAMLDALVTAVGAKDRYTRRHSEDVMGYALEIASALDLAPTRGLDEPTRRIVAVAALLHDVGKIGVPDAVLRKPGRLTEAETETVRQHPSMGAVIAGAVPGLEEMVPGTLAAIRHHHERWDGGGYPDGLRGEAIPFIARLLAVADSFSAMTSDRPYRQGMDVANALRLLEEGAGTQWDPTCVAAFLRAHPASP